MIMLPDVEINVVKPFDDYYLLWEDIFWWDFHFKLELYVYEVLSVMNEMNL